MSETYIMVQEGVEVHGTKIVVVERAERRFFNNYMELLEWAVRQTYEITVNSPEEYDALTMAEREKLDATHEIWL
jgi:dsDNA-specific endonuclease/ATPase MutS2